MAKAIKVPRHRTMSSPRWGPARAKSFWALDSHAWSQLFFFLSFSSWDGDFPLFTIPNAIPKFIHLIQIKSNFLILVDVHFQRRKQVLKEKINQEEWEGFIWYIIPRFLVRVWTYPDSLLVKNKGGLDAFLYLRFLRWTVYLFSILSFFGLVVLVPINSTGDAEEVTGIDVLSLAHVKSGIWFMRGDS